MFVRKWNYSILCILIAVALAAVIVDVRNHSFWAGHAFLTGLLTGFLTLGISIFGINDFLERRAAKRWGFVAEVAYRGLGRESRDVSVTLASLYCNLDHPLEAAYMERDFDKSKLTPLGELRRLPKGKEEIQIFCSPKLPELDNGVDVRVPAERLRVLLSDPAWVQMAERETGALVNINRETVAKWASLLMNSTESRKQLNDFSHMNEGIFELAYELQRFEIDQDKGRIERIIDLFALNDLRSRLLTNRLWTLADEEYRFMLAPEHKDLNFDDVADVNSRTVINY